MKKKIFWKKFTETFKKAEKKGEKVLKEKSGEMTRQIEKMGKLGGVLYTCF